MIDDMKVKMWIKDKKRFRKEIREFQQMNKQKRTLSFTELWQLVFGEPTLLSIYTYIPTYRIPRTVDMASDDYLRRIENESKKSL